MGRKFISLVVFSFLCIASQAQVPDGPGGVGNTTGMSSLRMWLDAGDVDGDGNYSNNPANNSLVSSWSDKSGWDLHSLHIIRAGLITR